MKICFECEQNVMKNIFISMHISSVLFRYQVSFFTHNYDISRLNFVSYLSLIHRKECLETSPKFTCLNQFNLVAFVRHIPYIYVSPQMNLKQMLLKNMQKAPVLECTSYAYKKIQLTGSYYIHTNTVVYSAWASPYCFDAF